MSGEEIVKNLLEVCKQHQEATAKLHAIVNAHLYQAPQLEGEDNYKEAMAQVNRAREALAARIDVWRKEVAALRQA